MAQRPQTVQWAALMRAGMAGLGLRPAEFWALTPAELMLMLGDARGDTAMDRSRLEELISAFPDMTRHATKETPHG